MEFSAHTHFWGKFPDMQESEEPLEFSEELKDEPFGFIWFAGNLI